MTSPMDSGIPSPDTRPLYGPPAYSRQYEHTDISPGNQPVDLTASSTDIDLTIEPIEVRAAFLYLSGLPYQQWADWLIDKPPRRLLAARWLAAQYTAIETIMRREQV